VPFIYEYLDYRQFLREFFGEQKEKGTGLSQLAVSRKMGITSTGFLSNVIAGRNNLTRPQIYELAKIIKLNKRETAYFENLVIFTQAGRIDEKNIHYEKLCSIRKLNAKALAKGQLTLFSRWYYVVVRELLCFFKFRGDYKSLSRMVLPSIRPEEARKSIQTLEEMKLIKKNKEGDYIQSDNTISAAREIRSMDIANFQLDTIDLARKALNQVKRKDRDISTITLTLSQTSFKKAKDEIIRFRENLAKIAEDEDEPDQVFQCNIQLFPMSRKKEE
jgi:uncharacterized protein (TIGR02147 family)